MGVVQKYFLGEQNAACFQYMGEECHKEVSHFHLKCEKCGTLIHLECHDLEQLSSHLMAEHVLHLIHSALFFTDFVRTAA
ncbi:hypothetical protein [uncultured Fibrobacter sp.]|uniref:hypothetical protein n=1 Tax=uncultured Fibrobacter sp. TaxID=261512 RepID=UPI0025FC4ED7|nr:hypothetical protein [uncultured Fibrobacter sp.]